MDNQEFVNMMKDLMDSKGSKKLSGLAKNVTLIILGLAFLVGVIGSLGLFPFQMPDYVMFLDSFKWFYAPLIVMIGLGKAAEKVGEKPAKKEQEAEVILNEETINPNK
ncbi:MAG: hypothetical protein ACOC3V_00990 [bacterium]